MSVDRMSPGEAHNVVNAVVAYRTHRRDSDGNVLKLSYSEHTIRWAAFNAIGQSVDAASKIVDRLLRDGEMSEIVGAYRTT